MNSTIIFEIRKCQKQLTNFETCSTLGLKLKQNLRKFYTVDFFSSSFPLFLRNLDLDLDFYIIFQKTSKANRKKPYIYCTALVRKSMKKYPLKMHNILIIRVISSNMIILFLVHDEEGIQTSLTTLNTAITRQYNCYFIIRTQNTQQLATCSKKNHNS